MYMCTQQRDAKLANVASISHLQFMGGLDLMYVQYECTGSEDTPTHVHLMSYISLGSFYLAPRARTHSLGPHGLPVVVDPQFVQNNTMADRVGEGGQLALREVQLREGGEGSESLGQCREFVFAQVQILRNGTGKGRHEGIYILLTTIHWLHMLQYVKISVVPSTQGECPHVTTDTELSQELQHSTCVQ